MKVLLKNHINKDCSKGVEILSIGTEILLGNIVNTNSRWISEQLSTLGLNHFRQTTIGDNKNRISNLVKEISLRSNLLITTGGLGPTPDDLTTEAIAKAFGTEIYERPGLWKEIKEKISNQKLDDENSSLKKQCFFPEKAKIITNPRGTAPGMIWEPIKDFTIITFPGVPSELKSMWEGSVYEYIKTNFSDGSIFFSKTVKFAGIGESSVSEEIEDLLESKNPTIAPYANIGEVKLRITAKAESQKEAEQIIIPFYRKLKEKFSKFIYGENDESLPLIIIRELLKREETVVFAESCTGGLLSSALTSIPGSSDVFKGSIIAYSNDLKISLLNIDNNLLDNFGAVSKEVAEAMAINVRNTLKSNWSIAVSGIAGPSGGSEYKPIGLVYISICDPNNKTVTIKKEYSTFRNRLEIQRLSVIDCLNNLRLILLSNKE